MREKEDKRICTRQNSLFELRKNLSNKNETRGITLIALVITIIVLLILAAVSIATLTGDNGILTKAQTAKERNDAAEKEETQKLLQAEANMNFEETEYNGVTIPAGMAPTKKEGESTVAEGLVAVDKNGNEWVWIEVPKSEMPADLTFTNETGYSEDDQANCDSITAALKEYAASYTEGKKGQGFNWTDEWYAKDGESYITENTATEERQKELKTGCGLTLNEYKETYQKMIKSVYKNGGFWIGRYEAGINGTTGTDLSNARTSHTDIVDNSPKAISQKDAIPYNYVYCSEAQKLAKEMTPDSSKTSSLLFGIQWDLVCKFIEVKEVAKQGEEEKTNIIESINTDSQSWGNYKNTTLQITSSNAKATSYDDHEGTYNMPWASITDNKKSYDDSYDSAKGASFYTLLSTGASEKTKRLNIYDLAGNEYEWTLEHATADTGNPCSWRGGYFYNDSSISPASDRYYYGATNGYGDSSFRPTLY